MRSIDNLREYALTAASVNATTRAVLAGYVDEIEREVEELRDRDYRNGMEDGEGAVEFADRLKAAVDKREDVTLWGVDYTPLPVDADGEVWHVGDLAVGEVNPRNPKEVERMLWYGPDSGWQLETDTIIFPCPERVRHHHAPTVEDVLREFASDIADVLGGDDFRLDDSDELFAEFAKRLRLAGGEE